MSYSAILPTPPSSFSSQPARSAQPTQLPQSAQWMQWGKSPHPAQLLDWLRLAARQVFGAELAARIEPYRACRRCVARVRWCGEGTPRRFDHRFEPPDLQQLGITPLTPSLILGAQADPYPAAEAAHQRTRRLLEHLSETIAETTGLEISILTRSPLLLRDLDLLADLDQRHVVTVGVLIPAADPRLARRLERRSGAEAPDRFELIRALAAHGIATEVLCTPIRAGENSSAAVLRELFDRAHQAGAFDVRPAPSHPSIRPTAAESQQLLALFHRLRLERGFPRVLPGRG